MPCHVSIKASMVSLRVVIVGAKCLSSSNVKFNHQIATVLFVSFYLFEDVFQLGLISANIMTNFVKNSFCVINGRKVTLPLLTKLEKRVR